jgi:hypothetical protein
VPNQYSGVSVYVPMTPAKPSVVFDAYWHFAAERQRIFMARFAGAEGPWTSDEILKTYKFTNAYRASDRVSQYLIRNVIYSEFTSVQDTFFRILLFKLFNKIETWELLQTQLGPITWQSYDYTDFDRVLSAAMQRKSTIYSAAYIMASGAKQFSVLRKHQSHLKLIELMMAEEVPARLAACKSMRQAFELLKGYPLIGDFLGYQLVTDFNYSELVHFSEREFTVPGPGARDGIRKCFTSTLWGRPLQLIDIQNVFCEVDKYSRVRFPDVAGYSGRTRIKQAYKGAREPIQYFYPPKWKLEIPHSQREVPNGFF